MHFIINFEIPLVNILSALAFLPLAPEKKAGYML